ncbi:MAG: PorT family protein [Paludibacteraceae bacterium]|nr:PorT family protein [Paludibacteraceae bacterium]
MKKKFLLIALAAAFVTSAYASKVNIGVEAGYDFSHYRQSSIADVKSGNITLITEKNQYSTKYEEIDEVYQGSRRIHRERKTADTGRTPQMNGFHVGPTFDVRFSDRMGLGLRFALEYQFLTTPGHIFDTKYEREAMAEEKSYRTYATYQHSLLLPIRLSYTFNLGKNWNIWVMTGPEFEIGLSSTFNVKYNSRYSIDGKSHIEKYDAYTGKSYLDGNDVTEGEPQAELNRCNLTWGLGAGFGYKNFNFSVVYDFGLENLSYVRKVVSTSYSITNDQLKIAVSYTFPVKK